MKDTPILEEELAEVEVGVDEVEVGAGCSQVHPSAMLQLSESQIKNETKKPQNKKKQTRILKARDKSTSANTKPNKQLILA